MVALAMLKVPTASRVTSKNFRPDARLRPPAISICHVVEGRSGPKTEATVTLRRSSVVRTWTVGFIALNTFASTAREGRVRGRRSAGISVLQRTKGTVLELQSALIVLRRCSHLGERDEVNCSIAQWRRLQNWKDGGIGFSE